MNTFTLILLNGVTYDIEFEGSYDKLINYLHTSEYCKLMAIVNLTYKKLIYVNPKHISVITCPTQLPSLGEQL